MKNGTAVFYVFSGCDPRESKKKTLKFMPVPSFFQEASYFFFTDMVLNFTFVLQNLFFMVQLQLSTFQPLIDVLWIPIYRILILNQTAV